MRHLLALLISFCLVAPAFGWEATLDRVSDGDSFVVRRSNGRSEKVRLYGIDAPERGQAFSRVSGDNLRKLLRGTLDIDVLYRDPHGRAVALVKASESASGSAHTVNEQQIRDGMAWMYPLFCKESFCPDWKTREAEARAARVGLWQENSPIAPWDWKHRP